jgi:hypothetical protein
MHLVDVSCSLLVGRFEGEMRSMLWRPSAETLMHAVAAGAGAGEE